MLTIKDLLYTFWNKSIRL